MVCIYCGHDSHVTNTRLRSRTPSVWRRRQCDACVAQFSTLELPDYSVSIAIINLQGKLEPFSRDKLYLSLHKSLSHRQDAVVSATALTETIIGRLLKANRLQDGALQVGTLISTAYTVLKRYDPPSANTYKAYHQDSLH
jgi:transcriptional regulator NrdR family protein